MKKPETPGRSFPGNWTLEFVIQLDSILRAYMCG